MWPYHYFFFKYRGLLVTPPLLLALFWPRYRANNDWIVWLAGFLIFSIGLLCRIWAQEHLHHRLKVHIILTQTGPYLWVRNPIYIGNILICVGLTVISGLLWLVPVTILWCAAVYSLAIREEEARLFKRFGSDYAAYVQEIPRWIPSRYKKRFEFTNEFLISSLRAEMHNLLLLIPFLVKELIMTK